MIELDGSYGEGGGQMMRTALALSVITKKPFKMNNIRANRPQPGLKNQHLHAIKALQELCGAKASDCHVGSTEFLFVPGEVKARTLSIDIGTAGSITLILQAILPPVLLSGKKVRLKIVGGTDVAWSPQVDYMHNVIIPHLRKYAQIDFKRERRGYYPKGGGKVDILVKPREEKHAKINLFESGELIQIKGISHASTDLEKAEVAERQAKNAKQMLLKLNCPVQISNEYCDTLSTGSGITLWAVKSKDAGEVDFDNPIRIGADVLGEKGKRAEIVGQECAETLLKELESEEPVDKHLADWLIPFLGLYEGSFRCSEITSHTKTNMWVTKQFLDIKFEVEENKVCVNKKE